MNIFTALKGKIGMQNIELADIIRSHRKAAGLSRVRLAELSGTGKTVIFDIEKGKKSIKLDTLLKILNVLNIKIEMTSPLIEKTKAEHNEKS